MTMTRSHPMPNTPPDIGEKLLLDTPDVWDVDDFEGHDRMAVSRGNTILREVFATTRTDLPKLIATVRWSLLRIPRKEFAVAAGMNYNGYKPMERDLPPTPKGHFSKYTRLLAFWKEQGISTGVREQLLDLLTCPRLLALGEGSPDLLAAIQHIRTQADHVLGTKDLNGFYHRVGYERGHTLAEKNVPHLYNTIWQREKTGTVPDCLEVVRLVDTLYAGRAKEMRGLHALRRAQGEALWVEAKRNQYHERTLEPPLATFLVEMERRLATEHGVTLTSQALREQCGFGHLHAERLIQCELIEGKVIEHLAKAWMPPRPCKAFLEQWNHAYAQEQGRVSFGFLANQAMDEQGYTTSEVAKLLNVRPPEERGTAKKKTRRSQRYRPDNEVRAIMYQNRMSGQVSVEALIQVLARDDTHAEELRRAYAVERERHFLRSGHWLKGEGLKMRVLRELANVPTQELARNFLPEEHLDDPSIIRATSVELQRLERGEGKHHRIEHAEVLPVLTGIASERGEEALARVNQLDAMDEALKRFTTVQEMAGNLITAMRGAKFVSEAMRNIARNNAEWLRADLVTKMAAGDFVSGLPSLRTMAKGTIDAVLPPEVIRDWHERFPEQLCDEAMHFGTVRRVLPRVLCTMIASKEETPMEFFRKRVPNIVPTIGTKQLRELEEGEIGAWPFLHRCLLAAGVQPGSVPYRLVRGLHEHKGDLQTVLSALVSALQREKREIHPINLPGLRVKELAPYVSAGKRSRAPK